MEKKSKICKYLYFASQNNRQKEIWNKKLFEILFKFFTPKMGNRKN